MDTLKQTEKNKLLRPFILTVVLIILDQVTKYLIDANIPLNGVGPQIFGDFLWIVHARNLGMAFSLGNELPLMARRIIFSSSSFIVTTFVLIYYFKSKDLTQTMRWAIAGIVAGGIGNLIDRVGKPSGVVDFISFNFYGFLGMSRFPAFNVADSSTVVSGILLVILFIIHERRTREQKG